MLACPGAGPTIAQPSRRPLSQVCRERGALVVYSLSRLARSTKDAILMAERLEKAGADLVSLSEAIDTTSAAGRLFFRLMAAMAEFERDVIAERTRTALAYKRSRGERVSRYAPFGYLLKAGELVPSRAETAGHREGACSSCLWAHLPGRRGCAEP